MTALRSQEEILGIANDFDESDLKRFRTLAPAGMTDNELKIIAACAEDDMDNKSWQTLFEECKGLTDVEEIQRKAIALSELDE